MSGKKLLSRDLLSCFLDLKRAATSFYLNPTGEAHRTFLNHAYRLATEKDLKEQIKRIKEKSAHAKGREVIDLADEMLTLGILVKEGVFPTQSYR